MSDEENVSAESTRYFIRDSQQRLIDSLKDLDQSFARIVRRLPPREEPPPLPPYWLHLEVVERHKVLSYAEIAKGTKVLEVGSGPHGIATLALAHMVGRAGAVIVAELARWTQFDEVLRACGLRGRVKPLDCDARHLPLRADSLDVAVIIHGIRSLHDPETMVAILREMLRVAPRVFVAESLPVAETKAQESHMEMYNLREEVFEARIGKKDDIHYLPLDELERLVALAGGRIIDSRSIDVGQPHFLAHFPREYVEKIKEREKRRSLLDRWDRAHEMLTKYGEAHPPVGLVLASRFSS